MRTLLKIRLAVDTFNDALGPQSGIDKELNPLGCSAMSTDKQLPTFRRSVHRDVGNYGKFTNQHGVTFQKIRLFLSRDVYITPNEPACFVMAFAVTRWRVCDLRVIWTAWRLWTSECETLCLSIIHNVLNVTVGNFALYRLEWVDDSEQFSAKDVGKAILA